MVTTPGPITIGVVNGRIDRSPAADPDVVVSPGNTVTWTCKDAPFMVYETDSRLCGVGNQCLHPDTPFGTKMQRPGKYTPAGGTITSPPVRPEAKGHVYKMNWEIPGPNDVPDVYD